MQPYDQVTEGEWVQPIRNGYKMECCDCGLVHKLDFRIRKGRVQLRAFRDNRATGQKRRKKPFVTKARIGHSPRALALKRKMPTRKEVKYERHKIQGMG